MTQPSSQRLLLIEDDERIGTRVRDGLQANGLKVRWCRTGMGGLADAAEQPPDIVLLDLGLPDADGIDVARSLRSRLPTIVLILITARDSEIDIVAGLDAGADDYLTKPFSITVLLARIRAQMRHRPPTTDNQEPVVVGALTINPATRRCHLGNAEFDLRPKEFDLLLALTTAAGTALTRHELMTQVWDEQWHGPTKTLDVTLASLRRRLDQASHDGSDPTMTVPVITTLRGHGYRLELPPSQRTPK